MDLIDKGASAVKHGDPFAAPGVFHRGNPPKVMLTGLQTKASAVLAVAASFVLAVL